MGLSPALGTPAGPAGGLDLVEWVPQQGLTEGAPGQVSRMQRRGNGGLGGGIMGILWGAAELLRRYSLSAG